MNNPADHRKLFDNYSDVYLTFIVVSPDPAIAKPSPSDFIFMIVLINVDLPVALRPARANITCSCFHLSKLLSMYADTMLGS